ncbi:MAG TPA: hypothetical protein PK195_07215, partial [Ignavibacteriaceae bacterium]|nr:hypothetical protein [Ignavibacteriaceae bacterium]
MCRNIFKIFRIEEPVFTDNDAWKGKDVFVSSPDISKTAVESRFPFIVPGEEYDKDSLAGKNQDEESIVDIGDLLQVVSDTVLVDSLSGNLEDTCGIKDK